MRLALSTNPWLLRELTRTFLEGETKRWPGTLVAKSAASFKKIENLTP